MSDLYSVREALYEAGQAAGSYAKRAEDAIKKLQTATVALAKAKTRAKGNTVEKSASGRKYEVEMALIMEQCDLDFAELEWALVKIEIELHKNATVALCGAVKTFEVEARLA